MEQFLYVDKELVSMSELKEVVDLVEKNKSILGTKTPPVVSIKNDCATGSRYLQ